MKKNDFIAIVKNNNGIIDGEMVTINKTDFDNMLFDIDENMVEKIDRNNYMININNKTSFMVEITKPVKISGGNGVKSKNATYHVIYKKLDEKTENVNDDLSTRNELVLWLKSLNKKTYEYIRIYDNLGNVCRKSAWIERTPKTGTNNA